MPDVALCFWWITLCWSRRYKIPTYNSSNGEQLSVGAAHGLSSGHPRPLPLHWKDRWPSCEQPLPSGHTCMCVHRTLICIPQHVPEPLPTPQCLPLTACNQGFRAIDPWECSQRGAACSWLRAFRESHRNEQAANYSEGQNSFSFFVVHWVLHFT